MTVLVIIGNGNSANIHQPENGSASCGIFIEFGNKTESSTDRHNTMSEFQKHYAKRCALTA